MHPHLLIPGLFWPNPHDPDAGRNLELPALERLLSRGERQDSRDEGTEAWLFRSFGVPKQQDWPVAPLTLEWDGGKTGDGYWLRADPVHLKVERGEVILADSGVFSISRQEAETFTETLNRNLHEQGLLLCPLTPERWYLRLEKAPRLNTRPLPAAAGRNISDLLPQGEEGAAWRRLLNEIQMLLYPHPLNEEREARGELPVNSVWLWGGGVMPEAPEVSKEDKPPSTLLRTGFDAVFANDILARALAARSGTFHAALPGGAQDCLSFDPSGRGSVLVVLDTLRGVAQYGDVYGWREGLVKLERAWFAPLLAALKTGRLSGLTLHAVEGEAIRSFTCSRVSPWKLWRGVKPFSSFASTSPPTPLRQTERGAEGSSLPLRERGTPLRLNSFF